VARERFDGRPVADLHPLRRIMPFIMPSKSMAFVLFEQEIPTAPLTAFLTDVNRGRGTGRQATLFHCVLRAIGLALTEFPRLNRFVSGSRLYERKAIELAFSGKQRFEKDAPLYTTKVAFRRDEAFPAFVDRILDSVGHGRSGKETATDREVKGFLRLPGPLLRAAVRLQKTLDGWNLFPSKMLEGDALYASAFIANLGSVGLDAAYHHLYEYGTIPIFVTMGRTHRAPVVFENGSVGSREIFVLRYTYDERIEDGFYAARALDYLADRLADPATLR
jgi:pyruvate/2-oxoglutarate dehydrogenase complex dihydrolipoamide acyltransferase (E2) component